MAGSGRVVGFPVCSLTWALSCAICLPFEGLLHLKGLPAIWRAIPSRKAMRVFQLTGAQAVPRDSELRRDAGRKSIVTPLRGNSGFGGIPTFCLRLPRGCRPHLGACHADARTSESGDLMDGKPQSKRGDPALTAGERDAAAVRLHDGLGDCQTHSCTFL